MPDVRRDASRRAAATRRPSTDDDSARGAELELELLRVTVAAEKGIAPSNAKRLKGSTRAELEADAEAFVDELEAWRLRTRRDWADRA